MLSICANLGFQTQRENPHFYAIVTCQGDIPFLLMNVARIKQWVENCHNQFSFQKDNGLKTTEGRRVSSHSLDSKICLDVVFFLKHAGILKLAAIFIQMYFTCMGSTCSAG